MSLQTSDRAPVRASSALLTTLDRLSRDRPHLWAGIENTRPAQAELIEGRIAAIMDDANRTSTRIYARPNAIVTDAEHTAPTLSAKQAARLIAAADAFNAARGNQRSGPLGYSALAIFRALLFHFRNADSGRCDPSYDDIIAHVGCARQTLCTALGKLEYHGFLVVTRRMSWRTVKERDDITGEFVVRRALRQISNAYSFPTSPPHFAPVYATPQVRPAWLQPTTPPKVIHRPNPKHLAAIRVATAIDSQQIGKHLAAIINLAESKPQGETTQFKSKSKSQRITLSEDEIESLY